MWNKHSTSCVYDGWMGEQQFAQNMESTMKSITDSYTLQPEGIIHRLLSYEPGFGNGE